ncbi:hypothetical protein [Oenococcus oeni]|uniref:hypothetical protein n=1 Tax=Oenococcus oeni TaxID=1247 RepID=UPI00050F17A4|nr:hypothetical protein [Oenococcus oeni]KGH95227.1 membrane protein [Oenococcus oeni IOEB_S450]
MLKKLMLTISVTWIYVLLYYLNRILSLKSNNIKNIVVSYISNSPFKFFILIIGTLIMVITPVIMSTRRANEDFKRAELLELEDNSFVPSYSGYFFISINAGNYLTMISFYITILLFMYFAGVEYFNPIFLLLQYHIYKVQSDNGVQFILILKCKQGVVRKSSSLNNLKLHRINNLTYIGKKE